MKSRKSLLQRLRSDTAGNTIAMMGAALLPLTAMIGGGVDASRTYMVKARLQQACDAGVLAGRKAVGDGNFDDQATERANDLFNANFPSNYQSSINTSFVASSPNDGGLVEGVATTELPTVVMKIFGYESISLKAECNALLTISNADVTMVLDTTGSMNYSVPADDSGGTTTRIRALRTAMIDFHQILETASASSQARIRYALLPYSGTVNVGRLILDNNGGNNWLLGQNNGDVVDYQSRRAVYRVRNTTTEPVETVQYISSGDCSNRFSENIGSSDGGNAELYQNSNLTNHIANWTPSNLGYSWGKPATKSGVANATFTFSYRSHSGNICKRNVTKTVEYETYDATVSGAQFLRWEYRKLNWPVADYIRSRDGGTTVPIPSETPSSSRARWAGCIEERQTVSDDTFTYNGTTGRIVSTDATDLNIDAAPSNTATRWRPYWPEVSHARQVVYGQYTYWTNDDVTVRGAKVQTACPQPARLLGEMTKTQFTAYANALNPDGGTYHDIGALWGARLSSPDGIFGSNVNQAAPNNGFVSRHMIFMTDGVLDPGPIYHSAYGVDYHDRRVSDDGSDSQLVARHTSRFQAICRAIKAKGIRLWVVAFATDLNDDLTECASPNSAYVSINAAALNKNFAEIAASIADLRLTK